ncbi:hypothetical protein KSF_002940 [Reticulibacter mediterranei]|uniref:Uncharacterized protein n=1 Tax=Reticulibacter mediterranei TaxID=2778369 RepID=A0A8J3IIG3_9CHLR|nr:hypothetical protein [Reticulibacter mediterranei]GHO90246.1 hypothetical protein KSF_002940 [Reticulibacter mediterranei]
MPIPALEGFLILFLVIALLTIFVTQWIAVPYTLGLVVVGHLLSMVGLLPEVHLTPELVLFVFLPAPCSLKEPGRCVGISWVWASLAVLMTALLASLFGYRHVMGMTLTLFAVVTGEIAANLFVLPFTLSPSHVFTQLPSL